MLKADSRSRFLYAPLQGETARRLLEMESEAGDPQAGGTQAGGPQAGDSQAGDPRSFVFLEKDTFYEQSNAVLLAMGRLGGAWRLIAVLYVFPRPVRDFVYRIVARHRYRWFGRRDACRLPTPEERDRFLP
jgi:predicted DCC family thiol-disulfide oxidoreductase YuxK